jgi:hypothetical protein
MNPRLKQRVLAVFACAAGVVLFSIIYVRAHPLVFNESFFGHAHCMKSAGLGLESYAADHGGRFPFHTNGSAAALALPIPGGYCSDSELSGPGYITRVYVQGMSRADDGKIAILFDKVPTPGGDHCHLFQRMRAPLGREVYTIGGGMRFIPESKWSEFSREQIELLVGAGIPRPQAEAYYSESPRR